MKRQQRIHFDSAFCLLSSTARVAVLLVLLAACLPAADFAALKPQGYVSDFAGVVDWESRQRLEQYAAELKRATGAELAIVTLPTLAGEPIEDIANTIFRKWGVGSKGTDINDPNRDQGIMLLLAIGDRRSRLEVGYGLEPIIPDGFAGSLLRHMRPALRQERYGEALLTAAEAIGSRIAQAKGVQLQASNRPQQARRRPKTDSIPIPIVLGGMGLLFWLMSLGGGGRGRRRRYYRNSDHLPAMILGSMLGRSMHHRHHSSGGGFGGYDSWDSFGGFGGGSSGGGGASSSW
mgnify:CR=1 FL=1